MPQPAFVETAATRQRETFVRMFRGRCFVS